MKLYGVEWKTDGYGLEALIKGEVVYLGYEGIIDRLHPNYSWLYEQDEAYQGDFYACGVNKNGSYAFISGSFGSCSGCDWLQSISGDEDAKKFLTHFKKVVIRKRSKNAIITYMEKTMLNESWSRDTLRKLIDKIRSPATLQTLGDTEA